jgi:hypothetical protein
MKSAAKDRRDEHPGHIPPFRKEGYGYPLQRVSKGTRKRNRIRKRIKTKTRIRKRKRNGR